MYTVVYWSLTRPIVWTIEHNLYLLKTISISERLFCFPLWLIKCISLSARIHWWKIRCHVPVLKIKIFVFKTAAWFIMTYLSLRYKEKVSFKSFQLGVKVFEVSTLKSKGRFICCIFNECRFKSLLILIQKLLKNLKKLIVL